MARTGGVEQALGGVTSNYSYFVSAHGGRFACMSALENRLPVPRVAPDLARSRHCFSGEAAGRIPDLGVSTLGVAGSAPNIRIIHYLNVFKLVPGVNADTHFSSTPACKLVHFARDNLAYLALASPVGTPYPRSF